MVIQYKVEIAVYTRSVLCSISHAPTTKCAWLLPPNPKGLASSCSDPGGREGTGVEYLLSCIVCQGVNFKSICSACPTASFRAHCTSAEWFLCSLCRNQTRTRTPPLGRDLTPIQALTKVACESRTPTTRAALPHGARTL